jgi:hypothetical protein
MQGLYYLVQYQLVNINKLESGETTTSLNMKTVFIKQKWNFGKSQELKGRSKKFKNKELLLVGA